MELREMRAFVVVVEEGGLSAAARRLHVSQPALVVVERLGVLLATEQSAKITGPDGVRLDALAGLDWVGFPRSGSPAASHARHGHLVTARR